MERNLKSGIVVMDRDIYDTLLHYAAIGASEAGGCIDHITEPRSINNYSIEKTEHISPRWELLWEVNPRDKVLLGEFTTQSGAEKILQYLKSNAQ